MPLKGSQTPEHGWEEHFICDTGGIPASRQRPLAHRSTANEMRVHIQRAGIDGTKGQRVQRIVLVDRQHTTGLGHARQLGQPAIVLDVRDMVKYAGRKNDVLALVRKRYALIDQDIILVTGKARLRYFDASGRNISAVDGGIGEILAEIGKRVANTAAEIQDI